LNEPSVLRNKKKRWSNVFCFEYFLVGKKNALERKNRNLAKEKKKRMAPTFFLIANPSRIVVGIVSARSMAQCAFSFGSYPVLDKEHSMKRKNIGKNAIVERKTTFLVSAPCINSMALRRKRTRQGIIITCVATPQKQSSTVQKTSSSNKWSPGSWRNMPIKQVLLPSE